MCGIAGFVHVDPDARPPDQTRLAWLKDMTRALRHRGPDGDGHLLLGPAALGHRRLSIIDLSTGGQPMTDHSGHVSITFNGEIYNYREIRRDLTAKGYIFRTNSDTEVILNAWMDKGPDCLDAFEGMFAFALWDKRTRTLFAARDRFGKKPFFYTLQKGVFAFASELTALRTLPFLSLDVATQALARFLSYEYVPTPQSIYRQVKKLKPAHYLLFHAGEISTAPYWDMPPPDPDTGQSENELCERLRLLLAQAVKRRLVSDVPLGVFLSGGIDSSTVAAFMAGMSATIKTFSIGFTEKSYDESAYARSVAKRFATEHHERILSAAECGGLLPDIVARFDEPMADPSIVPTYLLSKVTREKVTVALGGDGPDELFAGYEYYPGFKLAEKYLRLPAFLRKGLIEPIARRLPQSSGYVNPRRVAQTFLAGVAAPRNLRVQTWLSAFSPEAQMSLWHNPDPDVLAPARLFAPTTRLFDAFPADAPLAKVFYTFARQYMLDYILVKVDRCSMMHSLEVRAPFLDRDLAEFACRLPITMKLRGETRKYILKKAVADILPKEILTRPKRGFLIPSAMWLRESLKPHMDELLGEAFLKKQGLFNPKTVAALRAEHQNGTRDHRKELWTLLVLQLWLKAHNPSIS
ncbi:asparagine synthase (glutamine-hydrolyzing) [Desulfolutivibrio sulfoxidireducens]|uniref:asparagine synthase (glutamine-hydrolyzing) n=1 Tax=Desulfolutivibrio sulfoxidireducens TaxID=2773299 RepID=UPI00159D7547|nr:asparagine synthase (glutamine-hydrolyzing) [Desulfolutivibrio sulfoxidireducens]QLA15096.1 asparagine synthase (glutamine-hydrolyzing) [Desulfolutivibrio sulfoxidireducens]QLA18668.1 asparagine synthase (glutamine-hydrolyzing) [Desulfolutivibrio sulfoxidireducens]